MEYVTTPKVNILHDIFIAVFLPFTSAKLPYIINPIIESVSGKTYIITDIVLLT